MTNYWLTSLCGWLIFSCSWFCLWIFSFSFLAEPELAIILFPFAFRIGIALHTPKRFWPTIYGAELCLMASLSLLLDQSQWVVVIMTSLASIPIIWLAQQHYYGSQLRRLCVIGIVIMATAIINTLMLGGRLDSFGMIFLVSITGGLILVPSCYLIWSYLFQSVWIPLTINLIAKPIELRSRHIIFCTLLFILNIVIQLVLPEELRRFAPFCLAIPIILLAFRYGWKGALLGTVLNSIALIAARNGVSHMEITDLLLSLSAQSLTGILLGIGIQHQRELNQKLQHELNRNHNLSRHFVKAEESVRRDIARELHDEIGQNITAIRTQASILQRVEKSPIGHRCASTIEELSLNIYDTTKGLLTQLRPKVLDELGLEGAIQHLVRELECERNGISTTIIWNEPIERDAETNDATNVTLYRICQEALNNMMKYAQASEVTITVSFQKKAYLTVKDNGIGFKHEDTLDGLGLLGIRERVQVLGGKFTLITQSGNKAIGTELQVILPML
jgi:two-component system sensor histidine kinase UhpB